MKLIFIFALIALVNAQKSIVEEITSEFDELIAAFNGNLRIEKDAMINKFLNRTDIHMEVYKTVNMNIVRPLSGFSRFRAQKVNNGYVEAQDKMDNFFTFDILKGVLNSNFRAVTTYINDNLHHKVDNFAESTIDAAVIEKCWKLSETDVRVFFATVNNKLTEILEAAPEALATDLDELENKMNVSFAAHTSAFGACKKVWRKKQCVEKYVRKNT
jgi:hypothetical protein